MSNEVAIRVEHLSKAYRIGLKEQQHETLFCALEARLKSPFLPELTVQDGQVMLV